MEIPALPSLALLLFLVPLVLCRDYRPNGYNYEESDGAENHLRTGAYEPVEVDSYEVQSIAEEMVRLGQSQGPINQCLKNSRCTPVLKEILTAQKQMVDGENFKILKRVGQDCDEIEGDTFTCDIVAHRPYSDAPYGFRALEINVRESSCVCNSKSLGGGYHPMDLESDDTKEYANGIIKASLQHNNPFFKQCMSNEMCTPDTKTIIMAQSQVVAGQNIRVYQTVRQTCSGQESYETFSCDVTAHEPLSCNGRLEDCLEIQLDNSWCDCNQRKQSYSDPLPLDNDDNEESDEAENHLRTGAYEPVDDNEESDDEVHPGGVHPMDLESDDTKEYANGIIKASLKHENPFFRKCMNNERCTAEMKMIIEAEVQVVAGQYIRVYQDVRQICSGQEAHEVFSCDVTAFKPLSCYGPLEDCLEIQLHRARCFC